MTIWNALPQLAKGSHPAGSGKACIMNAISYGNGDVQITDMPKCTHPLLAGLAQGVNDGICDHTTDGLLCVDCSEIMWGYEPLLVGTYVNDAVLNQAVTQKMNEVQRRFPSPGYLSTYPNGAAYVAAHRVWARQVLDACIDAYYEFMGRDKPTRAVQEGPSLPALVDALSG